MEDNLNNFGEMVRKIESGNISKAIKRATERGDHVTLNILKQMEKKKSLLPNEVDVIYGYLKSTQAEEDAINKNLKKKGKKK